MAFRVRKLFGTFEKRAPGAKKDGCFRRLLIIGNIKISAVHSLADICFLHVLYLVFLLYYSIRCFSYAIRVNCVHI